MTTKLKIGLIGTGRLGTIYAAIIAGQLPRATLGAIAGHRAEELGELYGVAKENRFTDRQELFACENVDAVAIVSSTDTHVDFCLEAINQKLPILCEKPLGLDVAGALRVQQAVEESGVLFQMGFMRRWDPAYSTAKRHIEDDRIGTAVFYRASGRDATRTAIQYAGESGGILFDMGVHDFDLARFFMGDVAEVNTIGGRLVYPELEEADDIDNAIVTLKFKSGAIGVVDLSRNAGYGCDNACEVLGSRGAVRMGKIQHTPVQVLNKDGVLHDAIPTYAERFAGAFPIQLNDFVNNVLHQMAPTVTVVDGVESLRICDAALASYRQGEAVRLDD